MHSVTKNFLVISANLHGVKNVEKGRRLGRFSNVGWEKGNFGKRGIEMGYSTLWCVAFSHYLKR
ncbi:hypothetical protein [Pseudomonas sp. NPDC089741]|uniref:hypothetical protein n=1 Tax=Pseudomonas sp. NPDC089741 TaxID=3364470 RepID=UPI00382BC41A